MITYVTVIQVAHTHLSYVISGATDRYLYLRQQINTVQAALNRSNSPRGLTTQYWTGKLNVPAGPSGFCHRLAS
jgi:hypothetical protein